METLLTGTQMRCCDQYTSEYHGIPSIVLMERAALAVYESLLEYCIPALDEKIVVLCGNGNNGADGVALARILWENGFSNVSYCLPFDGKHSELLDRQIKMISTYPVSFTENVQEELLEADIIVDALYGIGLNRPLSAEVLDFIGLVNTCPGKKIAVDIASGIYADNGRLAGDAIRADLTVTFGYAKVGQRLYPGKTYSGELEIAQIGIVDLACFDEGEPFIEEYGYDDFAEDFPERIPDGNKGTFGKVLIYAGSDGMTGACILSARAAFTAGAGMVRIITTPKVEATLRVAVPEAMITVLSSGENPLDAVAARAIEEAVDWADVVLTGPGIGTDASSHHILSALLNKASCKNLVLDADALNLISLHDDLRERVFAREKNLTVFTPHLGELSRLFMESVQEMKKDLPGAVKRFAGLNEKSNLCLVAKDAVTLVGYLGELKLFSSGNSGMATAGSGDVLSGIVAALLAHKDIKGDVRKAVHAVYAAVYLHGLSGSMAAESLGEDSVMAGNIVENVPAVLKQLRTYQRGNL